MFGLSFATILTLVVTPAQLAFVAKLSAWRHRFVERRRAKKAARGGGGGTPEIARRSGTDEQS